jgi:hypothetical protein
MLKNNKVKETINTKKTVIQKVHLDWIQTNLSDIADEEDAPFYAFTRGTNLIYIGIAYKQNVSVEINQTIKRIEEKSNGLVIWLGNIYRPRTSFKRVDESLIRDIECLSIFKNQPSKNVQCKKNYTGRKPLTIENMGCDFLKSIIQARQNS